MTYRDSAGLLLSLSLLLTGASAAIAIETPSATPTPTSAPLNELEKYKLTLEQYKLALEQYRININLREQMRKEITKAFVIAIKAANNISKSSYDSDNRRRNAIAEAVQVRDKALASMGSPPIEPTKPTKPTKPVKTEITQTANKTKMSKPSPTPSP